MKKKVTALLLVVFLAVSLMPGTGVNVFAEGEDPPTGKTVDITPEASGSPERSVSIDVGETLIINVTNSSSRSGYDFTATLSKSGVVELQSATVNIAAGSTGQFVVTGLANGKVDVTVQNNNSSSNRKGVIHVTVGSGGSEESPTHGSTIDITPSTDNPEGSIAIYAGDILTVNVKNGSSSSAYDFAATLSKSGVAEFQGNSTINVAAGGTGQIIVKGLAAGNVDITIQNNSSYGSQYVRKGIVHLTVEESGDPVPVTGVSLDRTEMTLTVGGTGTLTATVAPATATDKSVTWSSSDTTVATVADGVVTAVAVGTATVTVTTADGGKTAACSVTVKAAETAPEGTVVEFMKLKESSVWLIRIPAGNDRVVTCNGQEMEWSSYYGAHVLAVEAAQQPAAADLTVTMTSGTPTAVSYPAKANDANGSARVDMSDVQYVYNLYNGRYASLTAAGGMVKVLGADVNKDGKVDAADATLVLTALREERA